MLTRAVGKFNVLIDPSSESNLFVEFCKLDAWHCICSKNVIGCSSRKQNSGLRTRNLNFEIWFSRKQFCLNSRQSAIGLHLPYAALLNLKGYRVRLMAVTKHLDGLEHRRNFWRNWGGGKADLSRLRGKNVVVIMCPLANRFAIGQDTRHSTSLWNQTGLTFLIFSSNCQIRTPRARRRPHHKAKFNTCRNFLHELAEQGTIRWILL